MRLLNEDVTIKSILKLKENLLKSKVNLFVDQKDAEPVHSDMVEISM